MDFLTPDRVAGIVVTFFVSLILGIFLLVLRIGANYFLKTVKIMIDGLKEEMVRLGGLFEKESEKREQNQNDISGIKKEVGNIKDRTNKVENRFNEHVRDHK